MWVLDQEMSIDKFLRLPFRTVSGGGLLGLVFLVARAADAPDLHRTFFASWSDIDDLTGDYLGVFTPSPGPAVLTSVPLDWWGGRVLVDGVRCLNNTGRLSGAARVSPRAVRMAAETPDARVPKVPAAAWPDRPGALRAHQTALNQTVGAMQEFFGIRESLVPCVVVVSLEERAAFAVTLDHDMTVYRLLKLVKTHIEAVTTRIPAKEAALAAVYADRHEHRGRMDARRRADAAVRREWADHTTRLAEDLRAVGEGLAEEGSLCEWMADRLAGGPLTTGERVRARMLLDRLAAGPAHGRLPRRLRRTLAKLDAGYPERHPAVVRMASAPAEGAAIEAGIGRLKAELDVLGREVRLGAAVVAAAEELGLAPSRSAGLLPERHLTWPITALVRPARPARALRYELA